MVKRTWPRGEAAYYEYDAAGQRTRLVTPDGRDIAYDYDTAGRLVKLHDATNTRTYYYDYDASGNIVHQVWSGGVERLVHLRPGQPHRGHRVLRRCGNVAGTGALHDGSPWRGPSKGQPHSRTSRDVTPSPVPIPATIGHPVANQRSPSRRHLWRRCRKRF